ncbi:sedoheptulose-1,7-bisphosphatase [Annulohypoxylon truncatum]|uniref:sedoheptulose-1,7-bisphosphatase n=1 Tax=Annulohypoxylon truncatum TaxID=327061 RepID=UPI002007C5CA|nr:sedoheptulose-1,7-bisphosphatase [Annulohypoxylon truncatum]KAI1206667.1 sedoheptulose-1,7-bisphosphatase [Annulohypoxylon truncatum]
MTDSGLLRHLRSAVPSQAHRGLIESVLPTLIDCISDIASSLRSSHYVSQAGSANAFGDDQLNVDVLAENNIRSAISRCAFVATASSEEDPVERDVPHQQGSESATNAPEEQYTVAFDPLDGSSIIAPNWTVGTIIGVWQGKTALNQPPASRQVAAVLGVYGPRTTAIIALRTPGSEPACLEIGIGENGVRDCEVIRPVVRLAESPFKTRYFAPANLRAAADDEKYMGLISHFIQNKYTLRYSGGLVPDVVHALVKGHGIYISPVTAASKAKLRRLYELFPLALIIECARGKAIDPADGTDILDKQLTDLNETAGLVCGTADEVDFVKKSLLN